MRSFHAIAIDHKFVFHVRADVEDKKPGNIGNEVKLVGSRAATVVIVIRGNSLAYGVARCQWIYQFNRKLARDVATGRAMKAMGGYCNPSKWYELGFSEAALSPRLDNNKACELAREYAAAIIKDLSLRAVENGYEKDDAKYLLDMNKKQE